MKKYIIIGNGAAGANAADEIRKLDPDGSIKIFTEEAYSFYYRPKLPEFLAGKIVVDNLTMPNAVNYQQRNIELHLHTKIVSIHSIGKTIQDAKGNSYPYDELLLSVGAVSNIPSLPGTDKKNVFALRTIDDALRIKEAAKNAKKVVLIGGGLLGLEAGRGMIELGLKVEVVEFFERLLPRQMDVNGAKILKEKLEGQGFSFHLGAKVKEVIGGTNAEGIILESGEKISGDIILFSAGIRPNLDLAKSIGLKTNKSIIVDEYMQTNIPSIFAAGDAAEFNGVPGGVWPTAMQQGTCAGKNMHGENTPYHVIPPSTKLKVVGINLVVSGNIDAENKLTSAIYKNGNNYRKIVLENGVIKGFIFFGNTDGATQCTAAMNSAKPIRASLEELQKEDFNFSTLM
ncbi:MAG: FAD-dependent oxidoreductase [Treponema sp.]|jgi:nitrite reductase (NADH) large subunit|nr:FAD-dependent oxidoreductase [Treponema sp.]